MAPSRIPHLAASIRRGYTFGYNQKLEAVASRFLTRLAGYCPIQAGADQVAFVDVDDTIRQTHG